MTPHRNALPHEGTSYKTRHEKSPLIAGRRICCADTTGAASLNTPAQRKTESDAFAHLVFVGKPRREN